MIDGSEKRNGWLNFERQSPHVIERRSNKGHFGTSPLKVYLYAKFEWGSKIFISHFV